MVAEAGDISCAFNSTVYDDTLQYVPDLLEWAGHHIDIVQVMVFILFRAVAPQLPFDWYAGGRKIDMSQLVYAETRERKVDLQSTDVVREIRKRFPEHTPGAYLNGTEEPDSFKWLLAGRIGTREQRYGYVGPKFLEVIQTMHHLWTGRYLAYARPSMTSLRRSMLLLAPLDTGLCRIASSYTSSVLARPLDAFKGLHFQSIMVIHPVDILPDGGQNMCDGCPDMTLWNGRLVWSCRMEELKHFGCWVQTVPKA